MSKFDIETFCATIENEKITFAYLVPPVLLLIAKHPSIDKYDLSSLRMCNSGAAPLTKELVGQVNKRLRLPIKQGYGLSETSPTTHAQLWDDWDKTTGSVGKLVPNMQAKYLAPDGKTELKRGKTGELAVKGPNVFVGYLNQPELTRECFTEDGYFKTGDIGHEDKDGSFYITDRVKELIKYKGFQVAPAELEGLLVDHPLVNDAAVIGVYDESQHTELPRAYIVLKKGVEKSDATAKQIADWLHQRVAHHKRLRGGVKFVDEIPKSASGKILRRIFKEEVKKEELKAKL
jgi:acyl-coenzyme A synthetase/AMP-(fatty) acid ligase